MSKLPQPFYDFGPFRLETVERRLTRGGKAITLTPKAFDILFTLVENSGRLLEKGELLQKIWPDSFVGVATLAQNICILRKILGEDSKDNKYIETVSKRGYRFIADVKMVWHDTESMVVEDRSRIASTATSIAVLPFRLLNLDSDEGYLGLGMADALIVKLGSIVQIAVRPTSAVRNFDSRTCDPIAVGQELKVESVLEGSIQRSKDRIRVTVQLVSVHARIQVWAGKFDEQFIDIFTLQDSISEQVATALMIKLSGEEKEQFKKHYTQNTEAYEAYLKGRYYWNMWTESGFKQSIEYFKIATEKDSRYALAYAGAADSYLMLAFYNFLAPHEAMPKAEAGAIRALEIDDSLAEAHTSLAGVMMFYHWDWVRAEKEFKRAIELNPNYAMAHQGYGLYLICMQRFDEALAEIKGAQELDISSLMIRTAAGWPLYFARQYDEAIDQYLKTIEADTNFLLAHSALGGAYVGKKMYKEAIAQYQKILRYSPDSPVTLADLGYTYAASGRRKQAMEILNRLADLSLHRYISPYYMAVVHTGLGERQQAINWLGKAYDMRSLELWLINVEPIFDSLRSEPGLLDLLRRLRFK